MLEHRHDHDKDGCKIIINCGGHSHHPKPCHCPKPEYANVYSQVDQTLAASPGGNLPGGMTILENTVVSSANIDVTQAAVTGILTINRAGWYRVAAGICGSLNPVASPLLAWTASLFRNGILIPGSTAANMTLSPEQKANEILMDIDVHFDVGDTLFFANTSTSVVLASSPTLGSFAVPSSAFLKMQLLEAD